MFSNPRQVAPPGIEPGTYYTISESLYQCATLPPKGRGKKTCKHMPHQHLDCNIPQNRQVPDWLWSTKKIESKYLAQGHKVAGCSGARTRNIDGLVITDHGSCTFRQDHACSQSSVNFSTWTMGMVHCVNPEMKMDLGTLKKITKLQ